MSGLWRRRSDRADRTSHKTARLPRVVVGIGLLISLGLCVHVTLLTIFNDGLDYGLPATGFLMLPVAGLTIILLLGSLSYHIVKLNVAEVRA